MSKINCNVAGDLIPLYVDEVLTPDSVELVEEHLAECESCTAKVESLRKTTVVEADKDVKPLEKIKKRLIKYKIIISVVFIGIILFCMHIFVNYAQFDYSYEDVRDHLKVISASDALVGSSDKVLLVYDGEKTIFDTSCLAEAVDMKDGKIQLEVTLYMTSHVYDYIDALNPVVPFDPDKPHLVYDTCLSTGYPDDSMSKLYNFHTSETYCGILGDLLNDEDCEIIRIYYGKWTYPKIWYDVNERYLLWEKK